MSMAQAEQRRGEVFFALMSGIGSGYGLPQDKKMIFGYDDIYSHVAQS